MPRRHRHRSASPTCEARTISCAGDRARTADRALTAGSAPSCAQAGGRCRVREGRHVAACAPMTAGHDHQVLSELVRVEQHIEWLDSESGAFLTLAQGADLARPVPGCDPWTAREVIAHVGELLRWSSKLVATRRLEITRWNNMGIAAPDDNSLVEWVAEPRAQVLATFRTHDLSEPVWGWAGDHRGWFWPRRMLFEVAVHRTDLERALGQQPSLVDDLVVEGIDEHLSILP